MSKKTLEQKVEQYYKVKSEYEFIQNAFEEDDINKTGMSQWEEKQRQEEENIKKAVKEREELTYDQSQIQINMKEKENIDNNPDFTMYALNLERKIDREGLFNSDSEVDSIVRGIIKEAISNPKYRIGPHVVTDMKQEKQVEMNLLFKEISIERSKMNEEDMSPAVRDFKFETLMTNEDELKAPLRRLEFMKKKRSISVDNRIKDAKKNVKKEAVFLQKIRKEGAKLKKEYKAVSDILDSVSNDIRQRTYSMNITTRRESDVTNSNTLEQNLSNDKKK